MLSEVIGELFFLLLFPFVLFFNLMLHPALELQLQDAPDDPRWHVQWFQKSYVEARCIDSKNLSF